MTTWRITSNTSRTIDDGRRRNLIINTGGGSITITGGTPGSTAILIEIANVRGPELTIIDDATTVSIGHLRNGTDWKQTIKDWVGVRGDVNVDLNITVPPGTDTSVRSLRAHTKISGLTGRLRVRGGTGSVRLDSLSGTIDIITATADIEGKRISGDIKTKTASGNFSLDSSAPASVRANTVSGLSDLCLTGRSLITINSGAGDVRMRLPQHQGYDLTAHSKTGHVMADGSTMINPLSEKRGGHRYDGDRSLAAKVKTVSGNIVLTRGETPHHSTPGVIITGGQQPRGPIQDTLPGDRKNN
ncbi:DUF4097 family beta strand repeat-containing protein [Dermatophilus congolensis]|uniref:DUF4097 family beta strand repeat-containing protein n=1 Tax=Dermatophilus congolensis TaxID=1863 RepID=UPI001AAFDFD7|nr:DUF4097 family beta strand repeat-containing protein [Dermatophilus congolensis]MBO3143338.1 DUF4097 family beta strand repeat protein [Dermatophilus congolensis]MBO3152325.1 DUF4097 family beta strand repeat protein [Dermatophilus congolensis]MBO3160663.1 DUF4097 family beta strand repeat protein [Dermatophilus congolensis]MBO3163613.1 DUF4097 family beta strand repeat protein [Dermatophilus congolensis]MBO3177160.1 DUF4097 family beta strand repeat protein [Dermatophilus congolensis]